jgi:hypothetical protein
MGKSSEGGGDKAGVGGAGKTIVASHADDVERAIGFKLDRLLLAVASATDPPYLAPLSQQIFGELGIARGSE